MEYKKFENTIVARMDKGEEILENLKKICIQENIKLANINAIGAVGDFTVGLFRTKEKKYESTNYQGDFEIVSLSGTISTKEGEYYSHIHMSAADENNKVIGGHLNSAIVSATCELVIYKIDGSVEREFKEEIGLNLFKF